MLPESKRESGDDSKGSDGSDRRRSAVVESTELGERKAETGMQRSQAQTLQRTGPVRARRLDHLGRPITTTATTTATKTKSTTMTGAKKRDVSTTSTPSSTALSSRRSATKTAAASSAARRARATPTNVQNLSETPLATAGRPEAAPSDRTPSSSASAPATELGAAAGAGTGPAKTKPARKTITVASRFMSSTPKQSQPRLAQQTRQTLQPQSASARVRKAPTSARGPSTSASASSASARERARTPSTTTRTSTPLATRAGSTLASRPHSNQARLSTQARPSSARAKENSRSNAVSTPKTTSIKTTPANGPLGEALLALDDAYRLAFVRAELELSSEFGDEETALLEDWKRVQVLEQRLQEARLERDRLEDEAHVALQIKAFAGKDLTWLQYAVRDVGSALARCDTLVRVRTAEGDPALSDDLDPHTRTAMAVSLFPTGSSASS